jgi:hypothetical protein
MLSVIISPIMLSVIMLNVIMLSVVAPNTHTHINTDISTRFSLFLSMSDCAVASVLLLFHSLSLSVVTIASVVLLSLTF